MTKSNNETFILQLSRFLASAVRFIISIDYIKIRIWILIIVLIFFTIMGQLLTKTALLITLIILGYIFLTYLVKWFDKRDEK